MTLTEIGYMVLETIRSGHVVDDERLDKRLIYDWVDLKRAQFITRSMTNNPNNRLNLNFYQSMDLTLVNTDLTDAGNYPYVSSGYEDTEIFISEETVPPIIEIKSGPLILSIESEDLMKLPYTLVSFDQLRWAGNGKFNTSIIFTALRDHKIYFKYNELLDTYDSVVLRAVFENPRDVTGFDEDSDYPISGDLLESIKNAALEVDVQVFYNSKSDEVSDSSGKID